MNAVPATMARLSDFGRGAPDPTTACCDAHRVASPYGDDTHAKGALVPLVDSTFTCVVCPLPDSDLIGQPVISYAYTERVTIFAGPSDHPGMVTTSHSLRDFSTPELRCATDHIAPADTPIPAKDARVSVVKRTREEIPNIPYVTKAGKWELNLPGAGPAYFDTKRDASRQGLVRLAITDYHAQRSAQRVSQTR